MKLLNRWTGLGLLICGLVLTGILYSYSEQNVPAAADGAEKKPISPDEEKREVNMFIGDFAYLIKGKLLDPKVKAEYDRLPDTLVILGFGDQLYHLPDSAALHVATGGDGTVSAFGAPGFRYSLFDEQKSSAYIHSMESSFETKWDVCLTYLQLAEAGKAEFPVYAIGKQPAIQLMIDVDSYSDRYAPYFDTFYTKEIPLQIKEHLVTFFKSEQGEGYHFITKDQRKHSSLVRMGSFTGMNKKELACIVQNEGESGGGYTETLLVFAYNDSGAAYLLYSEDFYQKVLLETVYEDPEERWDDRVYMDSNEKIKPDFEAIRIKIADQPDLVYVYKTGFDEMKKYVQLPLADLQDTE